MRHCSTCLQIRENVTCEGVLFTPPVGCSRLPSAVNDLATTTFFLNELHRCSFHCHHKVLEEEEDATSDIDKEESVQVALIQTHGGDGAYLQVLLGSLIGVSSVHSCLICSVRYTIFSYISRTPQTMGNRSGFPVPTYPSRCTSPRSSQF